MAGELKLLVSQSKYEGRITMLEGYLADLKAIAADYESLKSRATNVLGSDDDNLAQMQSVVEQNIQRVNNAIQATQASINAVKTTMSTMANVSSNVSSIIQEASQIAGQMYN